MLNWKCGIDLFIEMHVRMERLMTVAAHKIAHEVKNTRTYSFLKPVE